MTARVERRAPWRGRKVLVRGVLAVVALIVVYVGGTFVQVWWAARHDDKRRSDAIVVLGAAEYNGRPSAVLAARLDHALDLYRGGYAPVIVVTGGAEPGDRYTEAGAAAQYLHEHNVPDTAILRETTGRSSWESLAASARFLKARGTPRVILVSDPFHSKRIQEIAGDLGLEAVTSPTLTSPIKGWDEWKRFGSETIRVSIGRIVGFGRISRGSRVTKLVPGLG
ncbi:MAG: YdcF family protein [Actinomycetia bacterium]|nr:YdcF family protein [Actinomycetes bacterium]